MREAGVLIDFASQPLFWHLPNNRDTVALPDSRDLWDVLWTHRHSVLGFCHTHPGGGLPGPSHEDITTFSGIEAALGRRLVWWIASSDRIVVVSWEGPEKYKYRTREVEVSTVWLGRLRVYSEMASHPL